MLKIDTLILHCSDSSWGNAAVITDWHKQRGWRTIGYHYVICNGKMSARSAYEPGKDGLIEAGRSLDNNDVIDAEEVGAHARGLNTHSIGICLIGVNKFTIRQFESLIYLVETWRRIVPAIRVIGHCEVNRSKTCPNFSVPVFLTMLDRKIHTLTEIYVHDQMSIYLDNPHII